MKETGCNSSSKDKKTAATNRNKRTKGNGG